MHHSRKPNANWLFIILGLTLMIVAIGLTGVMTVSAQDNTPEPGPNPQDPVIDHSTFGALQGPFETPQAVTRACLSCHTDVAPEIMNTVHWTWELTNEQTGQVLGKKNLINNFCISIQSNEPRCTSCHIGYGWEDNTFDFSEEENIDCLVCHDTTGTYEKFPTGAGYPAASETEFPVGSGKIFSPPDLANVAQNIGRTSRETCGSCHFYGGGGDYVKHGDLDTTLIDPPYELDVHMSADGADFNCTACHMTEGHQIAGSRYASAEGDWQGCEDCHTTTPHDLDSLNNHSDKVACQTCHIPEFARGGLPTKMTWDWSVAGQLNSAEKPYTDADDNGWVIYDSKKGAFTFETNVVPQYTWYNGNVSYSLPGEVIDPSGVVAINTFLGDKDDPNARLYPVKNFTAKQPYDSGNNILAIPHLFGQDEAAYWKTFDWNAAITSGMEYAGLPYSGNFGFVDSQMYWPITHMVAPASQALACQDCHTGEGSRLDFVALGYSEAEVTKLTNFPPETSFVEPLPSTPTDPDACKACHVTEHELWGTSSHMDNSVGCVSCHHLEEDGPHPQVAFTMSKAAEICGACHINEYRDWEESVHSEYNVTCVTCHNPHSQDQMTIGGFVISCQTCHPDNTEQIAHSTHTAAGLVCNECHMNTEFNTGHTWKIGSDTCLECHQESIHSANAIITGSDTTSPLPVEEVVVEEPERVGINIPVWAAFFGALVLGVGLTIVFSRKGGNGDTPETDEEPPASDV